MLYQLKERNLRKTTGVASNAINLGQKRTRRFQKSGEGKHDWAEMIRHGRHESP